MPLVPRRPGRPPQPTLASWRSEATVSSESMWDLRTFAPFPVPYYEKYVTKNVAESIVSNDRDAWSSVVKTPTAASCRKLTTNGRRGNQRRSYQGPCGDRTCRDCASQKVVFHLGHLHKLMSRRSAVWVGTIPLTNKGLRTINKSFERGHDLEDIFASLNSGEPPTVPPWYAVVRRADTGMAYVYASGGPAGTLAKHGVFMDSIDAFDHARRSLRLPGIARVPSYSANARPPARSRSLLKVTAPDLSPPRQSVYEEHLEDLSHDNFGMSPDELVHQLPHEFDNLSLTAYAYALRTAPR